MGNRKVGIFISKLGSPYKPTTGLQMNSNLKSYNKIRLKTNEFLYEFG